MFRIGQKVVCVKPSSILKKDEIYKTAITGECPCGISFLGVEGIPSRLNNGITDCTCGFPHRNNGYRIFTSTRFRPIDEAFGENVAAELEQQFAFESDQRTEHAHR